MQYIPGKRNVIARCAIQSLHHFHSSLQISRLSIVLQVMNFHSMFQPHQQDYKSTKTPHRITQLCQLLTQHTHQGWPESCKDCPHEMLGYWTYRECTSLENGLLFKDNRLIISQSECKDTLELLHYGHYGVNCTTDRARDTVFWPGINDDIQRKVSQCQVCQENSSSLQQETMQSHEVPKAPWTKVGIDLFEYNKQQYLLVVDHYSTVSIHSQASTVQTLEQ